MRPSSSSNPNTPYRAAIASLVDSNCLPDERAEQADTANTAHAHSPFIGLSPKKASSSNPSNVIANAGSSSTSQITVDTVLGYLREKGHPCDNLKYVTIVNRLNLTNLSPDTLLTAIEAMHNAGHPLLTTLGINPYERYELINRLAGIVTRRFDFRGGIIPAIGHSNNDPKQLITNLVNHIRNQKR